MKIIILTNRGMRGELECDNNILIRDLRAQLSETFNTSWDNLELYILNDDKANYMSPIYTDDDAEIKLADFIYHYNGDNHFNKNRVVMYVIPHLTLSFFRPTTHNPEGLSVEEGLKKNPKNKFLSDINSNMQEVKFQNRLLKINFPIKQLPFEFIDSLTNKVMENPVITVAQKCVDASTVQHMLQFDASLAKYYKESRPNLLLRSKLEEFVSLHEKLYKNGHLITAEKSEEFLKTCDENIMRIKKNGHQFLGGDAIIGMDMYDSPDEVLSDIEEKLQVESPHSLSFIGKLDLIETAKLLVLTSIYNVVSTDIKRRGYSNLLSAFNEAKEVYQTDLSMDVRLSIHSVMKLHRSRWFRDNIIGCLLAKLILPSSARHLNRLGFFEHCTDIPYQEPRYTSQSEEGCILDIKPTP